VVKLGGFSAHGDRNEMLRFLKESNLRIKKIAVVHGEEDQSTAFTDYLTENGFRAFVPHPGQTVRV
jgi:metallo-beta-lactamase family protein